MSRVARVNAVYKALVVNNRNGDDLFTPFERISEVILFEMSKDRFSLSDLKNGFEEKYNISIGELPLKTVLLRLMSKKIIEKIKNHAQYKVIDRNHLAQVFKQIETSRSEFELQYDILMQDLKNYVEEKFNVLYPTEKLSEFFKIFFEQNIRWIISQKDLLVQSEVLDIDYEYYNMKVYFSAFIIDKCQNTKNAELIKNIAFGYVLLEAINYHDGKNTTLQNTTIVLDTPIIFKLLGFSMTSDSWEYVNLVTCLKEIGARLVIFENIYSEVEQIISSAKYWIGRTSFDIQLASKTAEYFFNSDLTESDIHEIIVNLRSHIARYDIEIIPIEFDVNTERYNQDELAIYNEIVSAYKRDPNFVELNKKNSIQSDATSINGVYHLRKGRLSTQIHETLSFMITDNSSLIHASNEYHKSHYNNSTIASCVSDIFAGTYVWISKPDYLVGLTFKKVISQVYATMQPNEGLWRDFLVNLEKSLSDGKIDERGAYLLKTSVYSSRYLTELSTIENYIVDVETPMQIIRKIKNEGYVEAESKKNSEISEIRELYENELSFEANEKIKYLKSIIQISSVIVKVILFTKIVILIGAYLGLSYFWSVSSLVPINNQDIPLIYKLIWGSIPVVFLPGIIAFITSWKPLKFLYIIEDKIVRFISSQLKLEYDLFSSEYPYVFKKFM